MSTKVELARNDANAYLVEVGGYSENTVKKWNVAKARAKLEVTVSSEDFKKESKKAAKSATAKDVFNLISSDTEYKIVGASAAAKSTGPKPAATKSAKKTDLKTTPVGAKKVDSFSSREGTNRYKAVAVLSDGSSLTMDEIRDKGKLEGKGIVTKFFGELIKNNYLKKKDGKFSLTDRGLKKIND